MPYKDAETKRQRHREYMRNVWYPANRQTHLARVHRNTEKLKEWWNELKRTQGCAVCGECDPACLDWHHLDPTQKEVHPSDMVRRGWARDRILTELAKCIVLCANCHRKTHRGSEADLRRGATLISA